MKKLLSCAILIAVAALSASSMAYASSETVLYSFPDGAAPVGQVQEDSFGNLYGTTYSGNGHGTAYQLKQHRGQWHAKTIHEFGSASDGTNPQAGLTPDRTDGIFYGSTLNGGLYSDGVVFSLVQSGRKWTENVLHHFDGSEGANPYALMTRDKATGVLYGTTIAGGMYGCGTAFRLDPATEQFNVLYNFHGGADGCEPETQMRPGPETGTLIGATRISGPRNGGTLFQLTEKGGNWTGAVLHAFNGYGGAHPLDITELADDNSIYGVAQSGGHYAHGVVFQLSKLRHKWAYRVIYAFMGGDDGAAPVGLRFDRQTGAIYGTTANGGAFEQGVMFKLTNTGGDWSESVLHSFGAVGDGGNPLSRPTIDPQTGVLYGTTLNGGTHNGGVVYAVTP